MNNFKKTFFLFLLTSSSVSFAQTSVTNCRDTSDVVFNVIKKLETTPTGLPDIYNKHKANFTRGDTFKREANKDFGCINILKKPDSKSERGFFAIYLMPIAERQTFINTGDTHTLTYLRSRKGLSPMLLSEQNMSSNERASAYCFDVVHLSGPNSPVVSSIWLKVDSDKWSSFERYAPSYMYSSYDERQMTYRGEEC